PDFPPDLPEFPAGEGLTPISWRLWMQNLYRRFRIADGPVGKTLASGVLWRALSRRQIGAALGARSAPAVVQPDRAEDRQEQQRNDDRGLERLARCVAQHGRELLAAQRSERVRAPGRFVACRIENSAHDRQHD